MALWQEWWVWLVGGVLLGILEVLAPGFFFLGFAVGAVVVGLLLWLGLLGSSFSVLLLCFAIASLVAWLVVRRVVGVRAGQVKIWDRDINDN